MSRGVESTRTSAGMADGGSVAGAAAGAPAAGAAGLPGPVSAAGTAAGAPPGSATGSFRASLIRPVPGELRGLGSRRARLDVSLGAGSRACRGLGGVSVAFDLVSRLMEVRAGVRVVLARLRAGGRVARVDCLPWSRVAKTKTADWLNLVCW